MKIIRFILLLIVSIIFSSCTNPEDEILRKPYKEELKAKISRGLICFDNKISHFLTWRKLPGDLEKYSVWRKTVSNNNNKIEEIGKTSETFFNDYDIESTKKYSYLVSNKSNIDTNMFQEIQPNGTMYKGLNALSINLGYDYKQARIVTGDLTGDGELELIVAHSGMRPVDPNEKGWMKSTDIFRVSAYEITGKHLWTNELTWGIEAGPCYLPMVVWDLDADSKSEVILKINKSDDPKNYKEDYLAILDGKTGKLLSESKWPEAASDNYNSNSRNYIAIAHLDGENPSIITARGLYYAQTIVSYDRNLNKEWERTLGTDIQKKFENKYLRKIWRIISNDKSRGSHGLPIADVDENGTEEILWGEHCITAGGDDIWTVEDKMPYHGHPDVVYAADILPKIPGKEIFYCREGWLNEREDIGMLLVDKNGNTIWSRWGYTHVDGGWAARVIPGTNEWQLFGYDVKKKKWTPGVRSFVDASQHFLKSNGELISNPDSTWIRSFTVDWEGDGVKELCSESGVLKRFNEEFIADLGKGVEWCGDIYGDYREELIIQPNDGNIYIVFNTSKMKAKAKITRLADRQYKNDLSRTAMQFNAFPTESGYIPKLND